MRHRIPLAPEFGALGHTEAVLFINHHHTELLKLHIAFEQCMRADKNLYLPVTEAFEDFGAGPFGGGTGKQTHFDRQITEQVADAFKMLECQDFGGCHQGRLSAVICGQQHGHQRYDGFPAAHIALEQAVHLFTTQYILPDFADYLFLRFSKLEWQAVMIEAIEQIPDFFERMSAKGSLLESAHTVDAQLQQEEFFELEAVAGRFEQLHVVWKVYLSKGQGGRHKLLPLGDIGRNKLRNLKRRMIHHFLEHARQGAVIDFTTAHGFSHRVHRREGEFGPRFFLSFLFYFRVTDAPLPAEALGFAVDRIDRSGCQVTRNPLRALEPHQFHFAAAVVQRGHQALRTTIAQIARYAEGSFQLHHGLAFAQFGDAVETRTVFITKREMPQELANGKDFEFFGQQRSFVGCDAGNTCKRFCQEIVVQAGRSYHKPAMRLLVFTLFTMHFQG